MINKKINVSLLNEIRMEQVIPRFQSPKFLEAADKYESFETNTEQLSIRIQKILTESVPVDIQEKHKAESLNWLITRFIDVITPKFLSIRNRYDRNGDKVWVSVINNYLEDRVVKQNLEIFYQIKEQNVANILSKKDINQITSLEELEQVIAQAKPAYEEYKQRKLLTNPENGINKIYEDKDWSVFIPETKAAACYLGKGTEWCTASPGLKYYETRYNKPEMGSPLIIFINRHEPDKKYQLSFHEKDFANKDNQQMNNTMLARFCLMIRDRINDLPDYVKQKAEEKIKDITADSANLKSIYELDKNNILTMKAKYYDNRRGEIVKYFKFFNLDGLLHRNEEDGPAQIVSYVLDDTKEVFETVEAFYDNGVESRKNGPAVIVKRINSGSGKLEVVSEKYCLDGDILSKEQWEKERHKTSQERDTPFLEENKIIKLKLLMPR